ncbi:oxidoreductase-like domain-containing protein [Aquabacterium sp. A3]|uniref:oxidoreductase-like domain-containing protein n=1 Tax=Aquabacterium sp. A3 TaxID=3132829 RepID=UPI0031193635
MDQSPAPDPDLAVDPMPQQPEPPDLNACCGNGCDPCIFDLHDMAMAEYRQAMKAWQARQSLKPS